MDWKKEWKALAIIVIAFLACSFLPVGNARFDTAVTEALALTRWYAREHVLLCLVPAFFIAGAISVFVSQASVIRYLGARANKVLAYGVASVSGTVLAVCSCTVLPLFAGIYKMGAGLGPATAFLYSGPAINVLAIVLTARVLGLELGIARAVGAVTFSVVIGLLMHLIFRAEQLHKAAAQANLAVPKGRRRLWQNVLYFGAMVGILVFANWARPLAYHPIWSAIYLAKWPMTAAFALGLALILIAWFGLEWWKLLLAGIPVAILAVLLPGAPAIAFAVGVLGLSAVTSTHEGETGEWFNASWVFAKQIFPLLLLGVLISGALLGSPGKEALVPSGWISGVVGGNSPGANFFASVVGAFMYFATLTEVPIVQGLLNNGMGKGPALALLLAGPALSLPSMLVIRGILGTKKAVVYIGLVVAMATLTGMLFGTFWG